MKALFILMTLTSLPALACSLQEARILLQQELNKVLFDDETSTADFCAPETDAEKLRWIESLIEAIEKNENEGGGDYIVTLCEDEDAQYDRYSILIGDIYCSGTVGFSQYVLD